MSKSRSSLPCLLAAQAQVAFNDNAAKLMLVGLAQIVLIQSQVATMRGILAALLVLPFVLFAPLVGWLADRHSKRSVLNFALLLQVGVMGLLTAAVFYRSLALAAAGFLLLAIQSCIFSPAKYGILKELVGSSRLGFATGWLEMLTIVAILLGGAGGVAFDRLTRLTGDPWTGALWTGIGLTGFSVIAWLVFQGVESTPAQSREPFRLSLLVDHLANLAEIWREKPLRLAALGIAYFYSFGGVMHLALLQTGSELHAGQVGSVTDSSIFLLLLGVGVAAGSLTAGSFCRKRLELGLVPIGGLGITLSMVVLGCSTAKSAVFNGGLVCLGAFAGVFTVPLNAYLQDKARDEHRGRVIAATNLITNLGGLCAALIYLFFAEKLHLASSQQFLILIIPSLAVTCYVIWLLPESLLRLSAAVIARCIYKVRSQGAEHLPKQGGVLLISNHVSYVDAIILQLACPRDIKFVAFEGFHKTWWLGWALRILQVIPISARHAKDAVRTVGERLKAGEVVCVFPEGQLTRTGTLQGLKKGFELMARHAEAPVLPVYLDSLWGSIFSYSDRRFFWKLPRRWPYGAFVNFGRPIPAEEVRAVRGWQELLDLGEQAFQQRAELQEHLGFACLRSLSWLPWRPLLVDRTGRRRTLSRGGLLAAALALAERWKTRIAGKRVGIVLPPGIGGTLANLALVLAGKIPVNLNFTAGRASLESCLRRAEIQTVISAETLKRKLTDFPWPAHTLDVEKEVTDCGRLPVLKWLALVWLVPATTLARHFGVPQHGDHEEAAMIFTSGSSGEPKGVILTHRNLLGNVTQFAATNIISRRDAILGCLPLFHSFGFTVTLWYPLLQDVRLVTVPSPLETKKIGEAVLEEQVNIVLSTPTFLRAYFRKLEPESFRSVRLVITGAEKLPPDLVAGFRNKFGVTVLEGYGLTETSPAASLNIPEPDGLGEAGARAGSVGRLLPGMSARIVDPETGKDQSPVDTGMLLLRGPNIFAGYLGEQERTAEVIHDGWFVTGDLARFDEDAFLFIEGRLSRFSKIGGEMVPHGTVEERIVNVFSLKADAGVPAVVVGVPDETKGEALCLVTTADISTSELREKLTAAGLPNLWIPRQVTRVAAIPTLSSGKLDLKGCERLARQNPSG